MVKSIFLTSHVFILNLILSTNHLAASEVKKQSFVNLAGDFCPEYYQYPREKLLVVMSFNVLKAWKQDLAVDGVNRLPVMHDIIADISPDLIGLQELYPNKGQESEPTTLDDFQKPLWDRKPAGTPENPSLEYWYYETGMILSRFPIDSHHPYRPSYRYRNGGVRVNIPATSLRASLSLDYYNVHLPYRNAGWEVLAASKNPKEDIVDALSNSGVADRLTALKDIIEQLSNSGTTTLIAGDFNSASHDDWNSNNPYLLKLYPFLESIKVPWIESGYLKRRGFKDSFRTVHPKVEEKWGPTWIGLWGGPEERIDYIYYRSPKSDLEPICSHVIAESADKGDLYLKAPKKWPSDHRALITVFKLQ